MNHQVILKTPPSVYYLGGTPGVYYFGGTPGVYYFGGTCLVIGGRD